jgi:hypothetical protein
LVGAARTRAGRHHDDQVGAEPVDLGLDLALGAGADGDQHHDGGHADHHAEHGQQAAQPVRAQRGHGDPPRLRQPHPVGLIPVGLTPRAARRAPGSAAGPGGDVQVVGDQHDGHALLGVQRLEQRHDLLAGAGVEVAGRLVGQQHLRVADQGAGDGHPLLLAAGQLGRPVVQPVPHPTRSSARTARLRRSARRAPR